MPIRVFGPYAMQVFRYVSRHTRGVLPSVTKRTCL